MPPAEIAEAIILDDAIPLAEPVDVHAEAAVPLLEKAVQANSQDPNVAYLLALAYKRLGKTAEARAALKKISRPDANVFRQLGLLSLRDNQPAVGEEEFARSWQMDPTCFATAYNLLLTRLALGRIDAGLALLPEALALAPTPPERRFLDLLQRLLHSSRSEDAASPALADLSSDDEKRLLGIVRSLGDLDTVHALLTRFAAARPRSSAVQEAYLEATLLKARALMDRCRWGEVERLLTPLAHERSASRAHLAHVHNMLGCCRSLTQDFNRGVRHFTTAIKLVNNDPRLHQNLALAHELHGDLAGADPHWNRFFELLDERVPAPRDIPNYVSSLEFESLCRLANGYSEKERWSGALIYIQRASKLRPGDADTLERLFHLYGHNKLPDEARRTLVKLRALRPDDPQLDLYEIDLIEVKNLNDLEKVLSEIERVLKRHPGDHRVEERGVTMVGNVIPMMDNLCRQLTEQMNRVLEQVRHLPNYQIDWSAVREVMRDLIKEFQKLRRITGKCLPLVTHDEHRRIIRELAEQIDRKIEACRSIGT